MFLKAFLVFSGLVLYIASVPTPEGYKCNRGTAKLKAVIPQINCSNSFVPNISFTVISNLTNTYEEKFCQVRKALNHSDCNEPKMGILQSILLQMQGDRNCTWQTNHVRISMGKFLKELEGYTLSLRTLCPKK